MKTPFRKIWEFYIGSLLATYFFLACGCDSVRHPIRHAVNTALESASPAPYAATVAVPGRPVANMIYSGKPVVQNIIVTGKKSPVKTTVKIQSGFLWIVGFALLLLAGLMAYTQNYFVALKLFLAGLALPIFAAWFSVNTGIFVCAILGSIAVVAFIHYKIVLAPLSKKIADNAIAALKNTAAIAENEFTKVAASAETLAGKLKTK